MTETNIVGYHIKLYKISGEEIGAIEFYHYKNDKLINLNSIIVYDKYKGKSYGTLLIYLMFLKIVDLKLNDKIKLITLDDSSDLSLNLKSIYYKLGFRITDKENLESMKLFFTKKEKSKLIETFMQEGYDYNDETYSKNIIIYNDIKDYIKGFSDIKQKFITCENIMVEISIIKDDSTLTKLNNIRLLDILNYKSKYSKKITKHPIAKKTITKKSINRKYK